MKKQLPKKLKKLKKRNPQTPTMHAFRALKKRVEALELEDRRRTQAAESRGLDLNSFFETFGGTERYRR